MADVAKYIAPEAAEKMRRAIAEAGGNEVYFLGYTDESKRVIDVDVLARGNEAAVPAVLQAASPTDAVIHNHPSGNLTPSDADVSIASRLAAEDVASYIVNNDVTDIYVIVEPLAPPALEPLDSEELVQYFRPEGPIAAKLDSYEYRAQQLEMVSTVTRAFNQDEIAIIEAGTGTGKTLAYLVPAILWALRNKERCVVSTNTINLQEQLVYKDIPFLQSVMPERFSAVLVKGRGNYVCLRKVEDLEREPDLFDEEDSDELRQLLAWAHTTKDGSKSDLNFTPRAEVWEKVASESDTCTRARCPHYNRCFVTRARREAAKAHVLVVNHHLLFADLALRELTGNLGQAAVLPPYQRIILDEAHHIEEVATNYFGIGLTRAGMRRLLGRLHRERKGRATGLIHQILNRVRGARGQLRREIEEKIEQRLAYELLPAVRTALELNEQVMEDLFQATAQIALEQARLEENSSEEVKLRLTEDVLAYYRNQEALWDGLKRYRQLLDQLAGMVADSLPDLLRAEVAAPSLSSPIVEFRATGERLSAAVNTLREVFWSDSEEWIRWIEIRPRTGRNIVRVGCSPLEVGPRLAEAVFNTYRTVVLTSATLAVDQSFHYFRERVGLNLAKGDRVVEALLPAPFDYERQAIVGVPTDIAEPGSRTFAEELVSLLWEALQLTHGRAFVLFTSYGLLTRTYQRLAGLLRDSGMEPLRQGQAPRHQLLEWFKRDTHSVLFGTDSFWEGVDVEGEALGSVIITRLPFKVPTDPVVEARVEAITRRGGNAFLEYTVPQAVLKFKQGFGRLIRKRTDRGCVLIFDRRVVEKYYGKIFLRSLPKTRIVTGPREVVFRTVKEFLEEEVTLAAEGGRRI